MSKKRNLPAQEPAQESTEQAVDVEASVQPTTLKNAWEARSQAMAEIAARQHEAIKGDLQDFDEDTGEIIPSEETVSDEEIATNEQVSADEQEQNEETEVEVSAAPRMVTLVVDGQQIEVPEEKVFEAGRRTLQKESAADKRLKEAAELHRKATEFFNSAASDYRAPSAEDVHPGEPAQAIDQEALVQRALQEFEKRNYERQAKSAHEQFKAEFPEIISDPMLMRLAIDLEDKRLATAAALGEMPGDPLAAYRAHGESIRKWKQSFSPAGTQSGVTAESRLEKKRNLVVVGGNAVKATPPAQPRTLSTSEVIEKMRQARRGGK